MSDDEDAEDESPTVSLGESASVEGVPLARVASRQTWGMARSDLLDRVGDIPIRTPEGPRELNDIFDSIDITYFESRHEFETTVRDVIGVGPIPTTNDAESGEE